VDVLLRFWPVIATLLAAGAPFATGAIVLLWRIAQGVKDVQHTMARHAELHNEHKAEIGKLQDRVSSHGHTLAALAGHTPVNIQAVRQ
jgi:TolA-binding protein